MLKKKYGLEQKSAIGYSTQKCVDLVKSVDVRVAFRKGVRQEESYRFYKQYYHLLGTISVHCSFILYSDFPRRLNCLEDGQ